MRRQMTPYARYACGCCLALACAGSHAQAVAEPDGSAEAVELRRAQTEPLKYTLPPIDPNQVAAPSRLDLRTSLPVPDRWRIMESLGQKDNWLDPYNNNTIKGDKPFLPLAHWGPDWFLNLGVVSDSLVEARRIPVPSGAQSSQRPGSNGVFGETTQTALVETVIVSASLIKGNTTFRPPDYEFKFTGAANVNHARVHEVRALNVNPQRGVTRTDSHLGVQEAFVDVHLRNVSDRYDFDSVRIGIQPFISDFRGFVFNDQAFGVRLFGNRDNNQWQYNQAGYAAWKKTATPG